MAIVVDMGWAIAVPWSVESAHDNQKRTSSSAHRDHSRQLGPIGPGGPRRDVLDASPNVEELPSFLAGTLEVLFLHGPQRKIAGEDGE